MKRLADTLLGRTPRRVAKLPTAILGDILAEAMGKNCGDNIAMIERLFPDPESPIKTHPKVLDVLRPSLEHCLTNMYRVMHVLITMPLDRLFFVPPPGIGDDIVELHWATERLLSEEFEEVRRTLSYDEIKNQCRWLAEWRLRLLELFEGPTMMSEVALFMIATRCPENDVSIQDLRMQCNNLIGDVNDQYVNGRFPNGSMIVLHEGFRYGATILPMTVDLVDDRIYQIPLVRNFVDHRDVRSTTPMDVMQYAQEEADSVESAMRLAQQITRTMATKLRLVTERYLIWRGAMMARIRYIRIKDPSILETMIQRIREQIDRM